MQSGRMPHRVPESPQVLGYLQLATGGALQAHLAGTFFMDALSGIRIVEGLTGERRGSMLEAVPIRHLCLS